MTAALSLWMFLGGPLVWGAWMVWRLGLYAPGEFLACLWPGGLVLQTLFLLVHVLNLARSGEESVPRHFLVLGAFGTLGTLGFLVLPDLAAGTDPAWARAGVGALSGFSLVALFYPAFTARLLAGRGGPGGGGWVRYGNLAGFLLGLAAYLASVLLSGVRGGPDLPGWLAWVWPPFLAGLLLARSRR